MVLHFIEILCSTVVCLLPHQSAWCGWRIHFAVFHHHNSDGGMMANEDGSDAAAAARSSSSMHGKPAPAQKNIVFSNLRLLLFPYNNIPLASPAIWFCSKPAIMPVEYYMLWTQPTNHLSELGNQTTEGLTDWRTKIVGTWYSLIIFGLRPPTQTYSFIHLFFDFILNILSSNHSAWLEIKDTVLFIAKVCIGTYLKLLKKINRCKSYE